MLEQNVAGFGTFLWTPPDSPLGTGTPRLKAELRWALDGPCSPVPPGTGREATLANGSWMTPFP